MLKEQLPIKATFRKEENLKEIGLGFLKRFMNISPNDLKIIILCIKFVQHVMHLIFKSHHF